MYKILVIATYDSFLYSGIKLAERIDHLSIEVGVLNVKDKQISERQLLESDANKYNLFNINLNSDIKYKEYDIIILSIGNVATRRLISDFYLKFSNVKQRPILISIFPGVIFGDTDSIISRINSDILLMNCQYDVNCAQSIISNYHSNADIFNYGLINIDPDFNKKNKHDKEENIYFIDQVKIPYSKEERLYVLSKLVEFANTNPDKNIFIKSRIASNEITVHDDKNSYFKLFERHIKSPPENLSFSLESNFDIYNKMDLCISFSSTMLLEAAYYGISVAVISDLGINKSYYTKYFLESGLLISFDNLIKGERPNMKNEWFLQNIDFGVVDRDSIVNEKIFSILRKKSIIDMNTILFAGSFEYKKDNRSNLIRKLKKLVRNPLLFISDSKIIKFFKRNS